MKYPQIEKTKNENPFVSLNYSTIALDSYDLFIRVAVSVCKAYR